MSTTSIIAETLVVGSQAAVWVLLLIRVLVGPGWYQKIDLGLPMPDIVFAGLITALVYTLGILVDMATITFFNFVKTDKPILRIKWLNKKYHQWNRYERVMAPCIEGKSYDFLVNMRRRIRITRGTTLNVFFITITLSLYLYCIDGGSLCLFLVILGGFLLSIFCIIAVGLMEASYYHWQEQVNKCLSLNKKVLICQQETESGD